MHSIFESKEQLQDYIRKYYVEEVLFRDIGPKAKARGFLEFMEFLKIGLWKSVRQKNRYLKNKAIVEKITKEAFLEQDEMKKMQILCDNLEGVDIPTASAILSIVYPEKYPVIDIRCLQTLAENGFSIKTTPPNVKIWLQYLGIIRDLAKEFEVTPRDVDMALFAWHAEKHWDENLYSKNKEVI